MAESNGYQTETELAKAKLLARTSSKVEKSERMFMLVLSDNSKIEQLIVEKLCMI